MDDYGNEVGPFTSWDKQVADEQWILRLERERDELRAVMRDVLPYVNLDALPGGLCQRLHDVVAEVK